MLLCGDCVIGGDDVFGCGVVGLEIVEGGCKVLLVKVFVDL